MLGIPNNNKVFFNLLLNGAENSNKSARELRALIDELDNPEQRLRNLSKYKEESNSIMWSITEYAAELFSAPFEGEEFILISRDLYNLTGNMEEAALGVFTHCIHHVTPEVLELLDKLLTATRYIVDVFTSLAQSKDRNLVINSISEVDKTASDANLIYRRAVKDLFDNAVNELYVIKYNSLYNYLAGSINSCEIVVSDLREIMSKYE